jgi:glyoxylase-like metal-dependent hydrolase (beta-lactamase superfamily II)
LEISEFLHVIECPFRLGINTTVYVYGAKNKTFIDSGISLSPDYQIIPYLTAQGVNIDQIKDLVNTHGHFDHMGGNARLRQVTGCRISAHTYDAPWIQDHEKHYQEFELKYSRYFPVPPEAKHSFLLGSGESTKVDRLLSDGDMIDLGEISLIVIHTPGHTPGCICLFDKERKLLFTGDSIQGTGLTSDRFKLSVLPLYEDVEAYKKSLRKVLQLDFDTLLSAHTFEPYRKVFLEGREARRFVQDSLTYVDRLENSVMEVLKQTEVPLGLTEITRRVPEKVGIPGLPWADIYVVKAHLADLTQRGVVRYDEANDTWVLR